MCYMFYIFSYLYKKSRNTILNSKICLILLVFVLAHANRIQKVTKRI